MRGIITATKLASGFGENALAALVKVGGISVLERHVRMLRKLKVREILVVSDKRSEALQSEIDSLSHLGLNVRMVWGDEEGKLDLSGTFADNDDQPWMLMEASMIFDERLPTSWAKEKGVLVAVDEKRKEDSAKLIQINAEGAKEGDVFIGCSLLAAGAVKDLKVGAGLAWLKEFLEDQLSEGAGKIARLDDLPISEGAGKVVRLDDLPKYSYDMRRYQDYIWMTVNEKSDNRRGKKMLLDWAQKSVLDWPAWYLHRPIEKFIIYYLCEYRVTPNQLTVLNNIVAFAAMGLFAFGFMIPGLILALSVGVLDGLDGKQARTKLMSSKWGQLEELFDKIYENGWYLAFAYYFAGTMESPFPYVLFWIIFTINMLEILVGLVFRFTRGVQLDDMGPFERKFRLIAGRRNTYMWALVPFFLLAYFYNMSDFYYFGFIAIVGYSIVSFIVHFWRAAYHIVNKTEQRIP